MADTGATYPQAGLSDSTGTAWVDAHNIRAEANFAYVTLAASAFSQFLRAANFGFSIPAGATIDGVLAEIRVQANAANQIWDSYVYLVDADGANTGDNEKKLAHLPLAAATWEYGGVADKWGATLTPAIVNDSSFGVRFRVENGPVDTYIGYVYFIRLTIYYTPVVVPTTTILPATSIITDEARINAEVLSDGGAACEGRFCWGEIETEDDFEWGSDGDPLSDDGGGFGWTISVAGTSRAEIEDAGGVPFAGTRCARLYRDGTNPPSAYFTQSALTSSQVFEFQFRAGSGSYFAMWHGNGTKYLRLSITSLNIYYYNGSSHDTGYDVTYDVWALISIRNVDWDAGTFDIYLGGVVIKSGATMATSASYANQVRFTNATGVSNIYLDNVRVLANRTTTAFANGLTTNDPFYSDLTSLSTGTRHVYEAQLRNSAGEGPWSAEATFKTAIEKLLSDTVAIADSIIKTVSLNKADSVSVSDSVIKSVTLIKADAVAVADAIAKTISLVKAEAVTISDSFDRVVAYVRALADTVTIADTLTKTMRLAKADTVTVADTFTRTVSYVKAFADTVTITDSISKAVSIVKADTMAIADTMVIGLGHALHIALSDIVTITDHLVGELRTKTYLKQAIARMGIKGMGIARIQVKRMNIAKTHLFR